MTQINEKISTRTEGDIGFIVSDSPPVNASTSRMPVDNVSRAGFCWILNASPKRLAKSNSFNLCFKFMACKNSLPHWPTMKYAFKKHSK